MSGHLAVRRYTADGELDATFGESGVLVTDVAAAGRRAGGVVVDRADRVVVCGPAAGEGGSPVVVARYAEDGTPDPAFAEGGRRRTRFAASEADPAAVTVDTGGRVVVAGYARDGDDGRFAVARYAEDGSLDAGFDWDGAVLTDFFAARGERRHAVVTDARTRVLVAGRVRLGDTTRLALVRYGASGWHDSFFDWDARWLSDLGLAADGAGSVLTPRSGIVVAGSVSSPVGGTRFALAKYRHDGRLAESFGDEGVLVADLPDAADERLVGVDTDRRDRLVVAGTARIRDGARGIAVARYTEDGAPDPTFDGDGAVLTRLPAASDLRVRTLAVDRCEKAVVVGSAILDSERRFVAARYNPDGSLDATFGDDGVVTAPLRRSGVERVTGASIDSRGRLVVTGAGGGVRRDGEGGRDGRRDLR